MGEPRNRVKSPTAHLRLGPTRSLVRVGKLCIHIYVGEASGALPTKINAVPNPRWKKKASINSFVGVLFPASKKRRKCPVSLPLALLSSFPCMRVVNIRVNVNVFSSVRRNRRPSDLLPDAQVMVSHRVNPLPSSESLVTIYDHLPVG